MIIPMRAGVFAGCVLGSLTACGGAGKDPEAPKPAPETYVISDPVPPLPPPPPPATIFDPASSDAGEWLADLPGEQRGADSAKAAVVGFLRVHVERQSANVPQGNDIPKYRPWFSMPLRRAMHAAALQRDRMIAEHPGDKPSFIEPGLFSGSLENPPFRFEVLREVVEAQDRIRFEVRQYETHQTGTNESVDRVVAVRESGRWIVGDILFGGEDSPGITGRLTDNLPLVEER